ncbi:MAG TPA: M15 family metallopeptidase [Pseudolabrys sp.]|nr:M15 family metallopeptidase [Pseudolabrys sp.]
MRAGVAAVLPAIVLGCAVAQAQAPTPYGFVDVAAQVPGLVVDMRYAGSHNFVGRPVAGYEGARCLLTAPAATALAAVQRDLAARRLGLKVFDCYRPTRAVADFMRWAGDVHDTKTKAEFYPDVDKRNVFRDGYVATRSGHSRGSTVDLTLVRLSDGQELDMGTPFDFFSERSSPDDKSVTAEQHANRMLLAQVMRRHNFRPYDMEWWHFTLNHELYPHTYFDFPVK